MSTPDSTVQLNAEARIRETQRMTDFLWRLAFERFDRPIRRIGLTTLQLECRWQERATTAG